MSKQISILLVKVGEKPQKIVIDNTLENMQQLVGGYIEAIYPYSDEVAVICNEEGKINKLPLNRCIFGKNNEPIDIIAGDFFIASAPLNSDNFESLSEELIAEYTQKFLFPETFVQTDNGIVVLKNKL